MNIFNLEKHRFNLELFKFGLLSIIFFLIIGIYWFLRPIKDGVFITMIGSQYLPYAKIISVVIIFPIIGFYGRLVDNFSRDKVFYIMTCLFALTALFFAFMLKNPIHGIHSPGLTILKIITGVSLFIYVKIFGSVMVAMFWSFVSDTTTPESAKNGYSLISIGGQIGNLLGPLFVGFFAKKIGIVNLSFLASFLIFLIIPIMYFFIQTVPKELLQGFHGDNEKQVEKKKLGLLDGFKFLFANPYLFSIYATISIFEIVQAILDFRFKTLAGSHYSGDELVQFLGNFGALTGLVSIACLVLGTRHINKKFGLKISLLVLPVSLIFLVLFNTYTSLYVAMWVLVFARAINYSLNQPSKEQLYITTSKEAKYKVKAWIEIFGTRTSEAFAQSVNLLKVSLGPLFLPFSTVLSIGLLTVWLFLSKFLGQKYKRSVDENKFIC